MAKIFLIAVLGLSLSVPRLAAVESFALLNSYRLLGTIRGHKDPKLDVLVIQNLKTGRSYTLQIGQTFGDQEKYQVVKILDKQAWIKDQHEKFFTLEVSPWIAPEPNNDPNHGIPPSPEEEELMESLQEEGINAEKFMIKLKEFRPDRSGFFE